MANAPLKVGLVGASGYWATRLIPNLERLPELEIVAASSHTTPPEDFRDRFPERVSLTQDPGDLFQNPGIDAVILSTPAATHFSLVHQALLMGKHVLVEKPLTLEATAAERLFALAERNNCVLMVDHTYLFSRHLTALKELVDSEIGEPALHQSQRANLGIVRPDCNVVWDLGYHDIYMLRYLYPNDRIVSVTAAGAAHVHPGVVDVCDFAFEFESGLYASVHASWLTPVKVRRIFIAGSRGAAEYLDDARLLHHRKFLEVDRGVDEGEAEVPLPADNNPLANMLAHFAECVRAGRPSPLASGETAIEVVRLAEKVNAALVKGRRVNVD